MPGLRSGSTHYLTPNDYATIFDINALYNTGINGANQTVAIVGDCDINTANVQTFRSMMGLASNNTSVLPVGQAPAPCDADAQGEPYLDVEWAGGVAKASSIVLVISTNIEDAASYIVNQNLAPVVSTSFSSCEANGVAGNQFWSNLWQQASTQGITSLVSSGDSGAAGCEKPISPQRSMD